MSEPNVDVIIAAHNPERRIDRSASSVLRSTRTDLRLSIVCHNADLDAVRRAAGSAASDPRVRFLELHDGIPSPSGPFNHGLDHATAEYTSIVGSDDELQPGAIDAWASVAERDRADMVIARLEYASGRIFPTPPVRGHRAARLDATRDRLAYRSAPLGLVRRTTFPGLRLTPGMRNGGDLAYVTRLWFSGATISFDRGGPAYVIHDDADDRVTLRRKSVAEELTWLPLLLDDPFTLGLASEARRSLAAKLIRRHLFGAIDNRPTATAWTGDDLPHLAVAFGRVIDLAPNVRQVLSIADLALIDAIRVHAGIDEILALSAARKVFPRPSTATPGSCRHFLHPEAPMPLALGYRRLTRDAARSR